MNNGRGKITTINSVIEPQESESIQTIDANKYIIHVRSECK